MSGGVSSVASRSHSVRRLPALLIHAAGRVGEHLGNRCALAIPVATGQTTRILFRHLISLLAALAAQRGTRNKM